MSQAAARSGPEPSRSSMGEVRRSRSASADGCARSSSSAAPPIAASLAASKRSANVGGGGPQRRFGSCHWNPRLRGRFDDGASSSSSVGRFSTGAFAASSPYRPSSSRRSGASAASLSASRRVANACLAACSEEAEGRNFAERARSVRSSNNRARPARRMMKMIFFSREARSRARDLRTSTSIGTNTATTTAANRHLPTQPLNEFQCMRVFEHG